MQFMKAKFYFILALTAVCMAFGSCKSPSVGAFYTFETECMGNTMDGTVVLRAWGQGASRADAVEQAKKQAIHDIIFKGVQKGQCKFKPLLFEVNAEEKYQSYFDSFFSKNGAYTEFSRMDATKMGSGVKEKSKTRDSYALVVRVLRADLEKKLIADNILKK